ncbi:tyrosine-type recombinase/integrase [Terasakiella pusilla]|uniref:tyrosine-type recombinase/integrase n=1 Tax=Terasakiella pusilla TaxID=64973 RepID=UPI003AA89851
MTTSKRTILDAANLWLARCEAEGLERATLRSYRGHVTHHIEPCIGDDSLTEFTTADVSLFVSAMLKDNSHAMTRKVLISLRSILSEAQMLNLVPSNAATAYKMRRNTRHVAEKVIPTKAEIKLMLENVPDKYRAFLTTAIFTGMRSSELRGLSWDHVDFEKRVIKVRQRADRYNALGVPKSRAGRRDIPMSPLVLKTLQAQLKTAPESPLRLVFPNGVGNIEGHANLYHRVLKPLLLASGIVNAEGKPKFGLHALRHAAASLFIEQGWTPKKIQTFLGHANITMTFDTYGHLFDDGEDDQALMAKLEEDLYAA